MNNQTLVKSENTFDVKKIISRQLEALRIARGLRTVKELAEEVGVNYESFNKYANGQSEPKAGFFAAMYQFGINLDWLVAGEGEMYRANRAANYARDSNVATTGVNNGNIVAEAGIQQYNIRGRGQRLHEWIADYVASHSDADIQCLVERMRRAFPEFERWEQK